MGHLSSLQSYYLGMSLQDMNHMRLVPKKDYVANRLVSGALQLARNSSLFLDETQLEQGQLDTTGDASRNHKGTTLRELTVFNSLPAAWTLLAWFDFTNTNQASLFVLCCRCA